MYASLADAVHTVASRPVASRNLCATAGCQAQRRLSQNVLSYVIHLKFRASNVYRYIHRDDYLLSQLDRPTAFPTIIFTLSFTSTWPKDKMTDQFLRISRTSTAATSPLLPARLRSAATILVSRSRSLQHHHMVHTGTMEATMNTMQVMNGTV